MALVIGRARFGELSRKNGDTHLPTKLAPQDFGGLSGPALDLGGSVSQRRKRVGLVLGGVIAASALTGIAIAADVGPLDSVLNPEKQAAIDGSSPVDPDSVSFGANYHEPVPDVGDATTIAGVRAAVPQILSGATAAGRLPGPIDERRADVLSPERRQARELLLQRVWAASAVTAKADELQRALESGMDDEGYHPFDDNKFTVTAWQGVRLAPDGITVYVLGYTSYRLGAEPWQDDPIEQQQLTLTSGGPLGYQLLGKVSVALPNAESGR